MIRLSEPQVVAQAERQYVAIGATVTMESIDAEVPPLFDEVTAWAAARDVGAGPPFIRYDVIDMARALIIEVGVPVVTPVPGEGRVISGVLPAGRYLRATHTGSFDLLEGATAQFLAWAEDHGHVFDAWDGEQGHTWAARLEHYLTGPATAPDPSTWETVLEFRLRD